MSETNYDRYFGTPEKAAWTASEMCRAIDNCEHCPFVNEHGCPEWTLVRTQKWLEREANDAD